MDARSRPSKAEAVLAAAFLGWQALEISRFVAVETRPPAWDQANHLTVALRYLVAGAAGRWSGVWTYTPNAAIPPFPPVYHLLLAPFAAGANPAWSALWVNLGYLALLALASWGLARELRRDGAGAAAAVAFACAPLVQELLREQLVDLPLTACAAAALWALVRCDGFRRRGASLAFGAAFGLGMLHKWSFFTYVIPAYWLGWSALRRPADRANALAAAALGLGLCLPWYAIRAPLVLVRLTQATDDFVVPFWRGGAFFSYLLGLPRELGAPLCAAAAWSAWSLRREKSRPVRVAAASLACAYVFWALLPNRQARYLLPGLAALPALVAAGAPVPAVWALAAWQAAAAALNPAVLPAAEDWKLDAALEAVAAAREPGLTAVAVIANAPRVNKLSLTWQAESLGLSDLEFRGVADVPWELSEFVLYKRGGLGPDYVTREFLPARDAIEDRSGWFAAAFAERRSWPLPDGTSLVLYGRRRPASAPLAGSRFSGPLRVSSLLEIPGASLELGAWRKGRWDRAVLTAPAVRLKGLEVSGVRAELRDVLFVPDSGGARLVAAGGVAVKTAAVDAGALKAFLTRGPVRPRSISADETLKVAVSVKGLPVSAEIAPVSGPGRPCAAELRSVRVLGLPLPPRALLRWGANGPLFELSTGPDRATIRTVFGLSRSVPFPVELPSCSARGGRLSIP